MHYSMSYMIYVWYELTEFFNEKHEENEESEVNEVEERVLGPNPKESRGGQSHSHSIPHPNHPKHSHVFRFLKKKKKSFWGLRIGSGHWYGSQAGGQLNFQHFHFRWISSKQWLPYWQRSWQTHKPAEPKTKPEYIHVPDKHPKNGFLKSTPLPLSGIHR